MSQAEFAEYNPGVIACTSLYPKCPEPKKVFSANQLYNNNRKSRGWENVNMYFHLPLILMLSN